MPTKKRCVTLIQYHRSCNLVSTWKHPMPLARLGRKREAEFYLDLGHEAFPEYPEQDPSFAFADYGPFTLALYHGLTHLNMGLSSQAWDIFNTYLQNPKNSAPERIRILIINHQGRA